MFRALTADESCVHWPLGEGFPFADAGHEGPVEASDDERSTPMPITDLCSVVAADLPIVDGDPKSQLNQFNLSNQS